MEYTFEQIPNILKRIENRLDKIEKTLLNRTKKDLKNLTMLGQRKPVKF